MDNPRCPVCGKYMEKIRHDDGTVQSYKCCGVTRTVRKNGFQRATIQ